MIVIQSSLLLRKVAEAYNVLQERQGNHLTLGIPEDPPPVYGNSDRIVQVIYNPLVNVSAHTHGGAIGIVEKDKIDWIAVHVKDNGSSLSPEKMLHIFEGYKIDGISGS